MRGVAVGRSPVATPVFARLDRREERERPTKDSTRIFEIFRILRRSDIFRIFRILEIFRILRIFPAG